MGHLDEQDLLLTGRSAPRLTDLTRSLMRLRPLSDPKAHYGMRGSYRAFQEKSTKRKVRQQNHGEAGLAAGPATSRKRGRYLGALCGF